MNEDMTKRIFLNYQYGDKLLIAGFFAVKSPMEYALNLFEKD